MSEGKDLGATAGSRVWRVWFSGGNHADVRGASEAEAKRGPWNPSFGFVTAVVLAPQDAATAAATQKDAPEDGS